MAQHGGVQLRLRELRELLENKAEVPFVIGMERGKLAIELYRPVQKDRQQPHERDEVYVVVEGRGEFIVGDQRVTFEPGDALFVPAGIEHRFENFGQSLLTWVIFCGPTGDQPSTNA